MTRRDHQTRAVCFGFQANYLSLAAKDSNQRAFVVLVDTLHVSGAHIVGGIKPAKDNKIADSSLGALLVYA